MKKIMLFFFLTLSSICSIFSISPEKEFTYRLAVQLGDNFIDFDTDIALNPDLKQEVKVFIEPGNNVYIYLIYFDENFNILFQFPESVYYIENKYAFLAVYQFPEEPFNHYPDVKDSINIIAANTRLTDLEKLLEQIRLETKEEKKDDIINKIWNKLNDYEKYPGITPHNIKLTTMSGVVYRGESPVDIPSREITARELHITRIKFSMQ